MNTNCSVSIIFDQTQTQIIKMQMGKLLQCAKKNYKTQIVPKTIYQTQIADGDTEVCQ